MCNASVMKVFHGWVFPGAVVLRSEGACLYGYRHLTFSAHLQSLGTVPFFFLPDSILRMNPLGWTSLKVLFPLNFFLFY